MIVQHVPPCSPCERMAPRGARIHNKDHRIEVRGTIKPNRAIAHDNAPQTALLWSADLEHWAPRPREVLRRPTTVLSTAFDFRMTLLVLRAETAQPTPCKWRVLDLENGTLDRKSASLGRWGSSGWQRRTKGLLCIITFSVTLIHVVCARRGACTAGAL